MTATQTSPTPSPYLDVTVQGCAHRLSIESAHALAADLLAGLAQLAQPTGGVRKDAPLDADNAARAEAETDSAAAVKRQVPTPAALFRRSTALRTESTSSRVFSTSTGRALTAVPETDEYEFHPGVHDHLARLGWTTDEVVAVCNDPEQSWVSPTGNLARIRVSGDIGVVLSPISDRYIMSVLPAKRLLMQRQRHQANPAPKKKRTPHKQLRHIESLPDMLDALDDFGFSTELRKSGHYKVTHPDFSESVTLPSSPSDHRWAKNALRDLRHTFGIDLRYPQAS